MSDPITIGAVTVAVTLMGAIYRLHVLHRREIERITSGASEKGASMARLEKDVERAGDDLSDLRRDTDKRLLDIAQRMEKEVGIIHQRIEATNRDVAAIRESQVEIQKCLARLEGRLNGKHK